jgi:hypothetical protein
MALLVAACSQGSPGDITLPAPNNPGDAVAADVTLAAGLSELQPTLQDNLSSSVDLARFAADQFDRVYELETPAGRDFSFNVVARGEGNTGLTRVSVGHVADNGAEPTIGIESLAGAGMTIDAPGLENRGNVVDVNGDGFARCTVRGKISDEQVLIVQVPRANDVVNIGIRISIGNESAINLKGSQTEGARPGTTWKDIYSSDSLQFGLPAIAVSGDRYSVAAYDGDPQSEYYVDRNRVWLQVDSTTGNVTGGVAQAASADSLFWRDQEIAALGNVLAVAYIGNGNIQAEVSLDRGATFPIEKQVDPTPAWGMRLVQIAIAPDYTLGVLYWRNDFNSATPKSTLVLSEATPTGFDQNNTPFGYTWTAPVTVHDVGRDSTPLLMHMEYSSAGDLVVGYGYTTMDPVPGQPFMLSHASFRVAIRMAGQTQFNDKELDSEDNTVPTDPHVNLLGSGGAMEIFYTYEKSDGVHLMYSSDAGLNFTTVASVPVVGALNPSVHVRMQGGNKRVDVLYCAPADWGLELHNLQWDNFSIGAAPRMYELTDCTAVQGGNPPAGMPQGLLITTLAWFGYDAVVSGDDVVVSVHEMTYDSYEYYWTTGWGTPLGLPIFFGANAPSAGTAPILLPGMTGTVAAADPTHRSQLRLCVLD